MLVNNMQGSPDKIGILVLPVIHITSVVSRS